jgi:hypothetical protein
MLSLLRMLNITEAAIDHQGGKKKVLEVFE